MTPETLHTLNDFRSRILKARELKSANLDIPPGLEPTDDEIREAIFALRNDRLRATENGKAKRTKAAPAIDPNMDLNDLFKPKEA